MTLSARASYQQEQLTVTLGIVMAREGDERDEGANTERASPAGEAEPSPHSEASPLGEESRNLQQVSDAEEEDPEAPPWNSLFELPVALLVLVAIVGLVMAFSR